MDSNPDLPMETRSSSPLKANLILGAEKLSLQPTSNPPARESSSDHHIADTNGPYRTPSISRHTEYEDNHLNEGDNNIRSGFAEPRKDKHPFEMTFRELNEIASQSSTKSERSKQAMVEIKRRPEYLKHAKSFVFAAADDSSIEHPVSTTPLWALQSSTTPKGPPPNSNADLPHVQQQHLLPSSLASSYRSSLNSSKCLIPSPTRSLAHAEQLFQQALPPSITHQSAGLSSWHPPTKDPWVIPSPPGAPIPVDYVVQPARDIEALGDHTAFIPEQAWLSADNLPPAMSFIEYSVPRQRNGEISRSITDALPASISNDVEGWRLAYWFRRYPNVELKDVADRIHLPLGRTARSKEELQKLCNSLSMRHQRWCEREGGFMFSRASKNKVSAKQLEIIERALLLNGFEGLERNTIWTLDQSIGQSIQPMLRGAKNFCGTRCVAPQRAALHPRVEAAFRMYGLVVNESKSRGLANWRKLKKKYWPGTDEMDEETDEQEDDNYMQINDEDEVGILQERPTLSEPAHTVHLNYDTSFDQSHAAQRSSPSQDRGSASAQLLSTEFMPMRPSLQRQLPNSPWPQQPHSFQHWGAASYQHVNNYRADSLGPLTHGLPLQPVIGTTPPVIYNLSSILGHTNDKRPTMSRTNRVPNPVIDNWLARELDQYDARQWEDEVDFIDIQNQVLVHLVAQGIADTEAFMMHERALRLYEAAQQQNRARFMINQAARVNALSLEQNGARCTSFNDLTSPEHKAMPASSHTPPTPTKAPNPKRMRLSTSPTPTHPVKPFAAAQTLEPAARKVEIDESYDVDEENEGADWDTIMA